MVYSHKLTNIDDILSNDTPILNEAYVGKSETLLEIENKIGELRKGLKITSSVNTSKTMLEINRLFEKQFGMEVFALEMIKTTQPNAYTWSIGMHTHINSNNMRDYVVGNPNTGYKYKDGNKLCVVVSISYGLLGDGKYSNSEILSIILHEIGHNFADCLHNKLALENAEMVEAYNRYLIAYTILLTVILAVTLACSFIPGKALIVDAIIGAILEKIIKEDVASTKELLKLNMDFLNRMHKINQKFEHKQRISSFIFGKYNEVNDLVNDMTDALSRTSSFSVDALEDYKKSEAKNKNKYRDSLSRQNEVFADKFTAVYGYGIDLANALNILSDVTGQRSYQIANRMGDRAKKINEIYTESLFDINDYDEHPNELQIISGNLHTLEKEFAKDDIDPRVREELTYQISEIKKIVDDMCNASTKTANISKKKAEYFKKLKDQDKTDPTSKVLEDYIDTILDDALKEAKKKDTERYNKLKK